MDFVSVDKPFASAVVIVRDDKVLGVSRKDNHNDFGLPCGKIEEDESSTQAAVRELYEETGMVVNEDDLIELFSGVDAQNNLVITFLVEDPEGEPISTEEGVTQWVTWTDLLAGTYGDYNCSVYWSYLAHE